MAEQSKPTMIVRIAFPGRYLIDYQDACFVADLVRGDVIADVCSVAFIGQSL